MKTLIIAHRDADGICSAVGFGINQLKIDKISNSFENILSNFDIVDMQYGEDLFKNLKAKSFSLDDYKKVVLVDFSLDLNIMKNLNKKLKDNFIWIDHHKRKYEEVEKEIINIKGLRNYKFAASVLVWKYFDKEVPKFIEYIGDMDLWKFELPDSRNLIAGIIDLKAPFNYKNLKYVYDLINNETFEQRKNEIINKGKTIRDHEKNLIKNLCFSGKIINFEGYKTFLINTSFVSSLISDYIFSSKEFKDVKIVFTWQRIYLDNNCFDKCSLRSQAPLDISLIAKKYNGNGHAQAAGFAIDNIDNLNL